MIVGMCGWALLQAMLDAVATLLLLLPLRLLHVLPTVHSRPKAVSAWVGWPRRQCNTGGFWWWGGLLQATGHDCRPQWWQWPTATPAMSACVVSAMHTNMLLCVAVGGQPPAPGPAVPPHLHRSLAATAVPCSAPRTRPRQQAAHGLQAPHNRRRRHRHRHRRRRRRRRRRRCAATAPLHHRLHHCLHHRRPPCCRRAALTANAPALHCSVFALLRCPPLAAPAQRRRLRCCLRPLAQGVHVLIYEVYN